MSVLIVDDEKLLLDAIVFEFEMEGIEAQGASSAKQALEIMEQSPIDVLISDVRMPGMGGIELLEAVRKKNRSKPAVIFISGYADITPEEAFHKGVNYFLSKPFDPEQLVKLVHKYTDSPDLALNSSSLSSIEIFETKVANIDFLDHVENTEQIQLGRSGAFIPCQDHNLQVGSKIVLNATATEGSFPRLEILSSIRWVRNSSENRNEIPGIGIEFEQFIEPKRQNFIEKMEQVDPLPFIPKGARK